MKRPYQKRWWHDEDVRSCVWALAVGLAAAAALLWREWQATDPWRGASGEEQEASSEEREARVEGQKEAR